MAISGFRHSHPSLGNGSPWLAQRGHRFIGNALEIGCVEPGVVLRPVIPVEMDEVPATVDLCDRSKLSMIPKTGHVHPDPLSSV